MDLNSSSSSSSSSSSLIPLLLELEHIIYNTHGRAFIEPDFGLANEK